MHYIESGVGAPLVLLHAFPLDARMWNSARARLEDRTRVITPDQRGLGESPLDGSSARPLAGGANAAGEPSLELIAADVLELMDRLELPRAVVGGCSMGGYVAMAMLRAAPERVAGLLLVDTKASADGPEQQSKRRAVADRADSSGTSGWLASDMVPNLLGSTTQQQRPEVVEQVRGLIEEQPAQGVAWAQRAMAARPDSTEGLRGFQGPALVVVGAEDGITPPREAEGMAELLPEGELVTLPGVGHLPALEDPDAFTAAIGPWLNRIG